MTPDKVTPYTDAEIAARQLVFLDGWVRPLFTAGAIHFPAARGRLRARVRERLGQFERGLPLASWPAA